MDPTSLLLSTKILLPTSTVDRRDTQKHNPLDQQKDKSNSTQNNSSSDNSKGYSPELMKAFSLLESLLTELLQKISESKEQNQPKQPEQPPTETNPLTPPPPPRIEPIVSDPGTSELEWAPPPSPDLVSPEPTPSNPVYLELSSSQKDILNGDFRAQLEHTGATITDRNSDEKVSAGDTFRSILNRGTDFEGTLEHTLSADEASHINGEFGEKISINSHEEQMNIDRALGLDDRFESASFAFDKNGDQVLSAGDIVVIQETHATMGNILGDWPLEFPTQYHRLTNEDIENIRTGNPEKNNPALELTKLEPELSLPRPEPEPNPNLPKTEFFHWFNDNVGDFNKDETVNAQDVRDWLKTAPPPNEEGKGMPIPAGSPDGDTGIPSYNPDVGIENTLGISGDDPSYSTSPDGGIENTLGISGDEPRSSHTETLDEHGHVVSSSTEVYDENGKAIGAADSLGAHGAPSPDNPGGSSTSSADSPDSLGSRGENGSTMTD